MEGSQNLTEVLRKYMIQSLCTLVSLKRSKIQLADTPFVEKEEAREVGLCRVVHLGLQMLQKPNIQSSNREKK